MMSICNNQGRNDVVLTLPAAMGLTKMIYDGNPTAKKNDVFPIHIIKQKISY